MNTIFSDIQLLATRLHRRRRRRGARVRQPLRLEIVFRFASRVRPSRRYVTWLVLKRPSHASIARRAARAWVATDYVASVAIRQHHARRRSRCRRGRRRAWRRRVARVRKRVVLNVVQGLARFAGRHDVTRLEVVWRARTPVAHRAACLLVERVASAGGNGAWRDGGRVRRRGRGRGGGWLGRWRSGWIGRRRRGRARRRRFWRRRGGRWKQLVVWKTREDFRDRVGVVVVAAPQVVFALLLRGGYSGIGTVGAWKRVEVALSRRWWGRGRRGLRRGRRRRRQEARKHHPVGGCIGVVAAPPAGVFDAIIGRVVLAEWSSALASKGGAAVDARAAHITRRRVRIGRWCGWGRRKTVSLLDITRVDFRGRPIRVPATSKGVRTQVFVGVDVGSRAIRTR